MADSQLPAGGFRWVEPGGAAPTGGLPPAGPPRWRRWGPLAAAAVALVLVAAGVGVVTWRKSGQTGPHAGAEAAEAALGTPPELLIPFSLQRQPVPTWTVTATDIGLPPEIKVGLPFASSGDRGYFIASCQSRTCYPWTQWVYGLNLRTGERLFPPIQLDEFNGQCYGNGPTVAVCLYDGDEELGHPHRAWVIDLEHGAITYTGPTELYVHGLLHNANGPVPSVYPVGTFRGESRLVAFVDGKGVYGVGSSTELTWFVPGNGVLHVPIYEETIDIPAVPVAGQSADRSGPRPQTDRVFSVLDGTDLTPQAPDGLTLGKAFVYNGGFAYEFTVGGGRGGILLYDTTGKLLARQQPDGANLFMMDDAETPIALQSPGARWQVYTRTGKPVLAIPASTEVTYFRVIGTRLYAQTSPDQSYDDQTWASWDLTTGRPGPTCPLLLGLGNYTGSDGTIVIQQDGMGRQSAKAIDPTTCRTVWETTTTSPTGWFDLLIKVGPHLIRNDVDGYSYTGLGPPA